MIQDDIINELQFIPEAKLKELYELIHSFRLKLNNDALNQTVETEDFKIDKALCLNSLKKITRGDFSSFTEIEDIEIHIQNLKNEIS